MRFEGGRQRVMRLGWERPGSPAARSVRTNRMREILHVRVCGGRRGQPRPLPGSEPPLALSVPLSRFTPRVGGGSAFYVRPKDMDPRIQIWNVLHDGEITAISGEDGETLTMFVSIPYLRRRSEPLGDSFVLTLGGLKRLEFRNFDGTTTPLREEIDISTPGILSTESEAMPVRIETTMGQSILDFEGIRLGMDTGQQIEY